jgi:dTDP-4-dehydrorhamnose 3,5-epimerase
MKIEETSIDGVLILTPTRFGDDRGWFSETYTRRALAAYGFDKEFVQDNHSLSKPVGTVRGLHFQTQPFGQDKLVRCVRGEAFDVVVDIRHGSPTFGRHITIPISADNGVQVLVPIGMAHGFCTLSPDTEITYKVTNYYSKQHDGGILWNDEALRIDWPVETSGAQVSEKDANAPRLADLGPLFRY